MSENLYCANCSEEIRWTPTMWEGEPYCCDGCAMGGPCVCTYTGAPPRLDVAKILEEVGMEVNARPSSESASHIECENCFEILERPAYYHEGKPYCCEGCTDGGPCLCTYRNAPPDAKPKVKIEANDKHQDLGESTSLKRRANSLWKKASQDVEEPQGEIRASTKANSLWNGQDESVEASADDFSEQDAPTIIDLEPETEHEPDRESLDRDFGPARSERFQVSVSPLTELRDLRRFTTRLEAVRSISNVMLLHYAGERANFEVEASSTMSVIKDIMDIESFAVRSLRMTPEGLSIMLETESEGEARVQVPAKELVAATIGVQSAEQAPNELTESVAQTLEAHSSGARVGDEGELHSFKYEMGVDVFFNGRHQVEIGDVKGPVHMHSWRVQAILEGESFSESGQVVGSRDVREIISSLVTPWNDKMLNRVPPFDEIMPTANNVARYIFDYVWNEIVGASARLKSIRLWESPTSYVEYAGEGYGAV